jgi:cellulose synthase operon protein C
MMHVRLALFGAVFLLTSCSTTVDNKGTIGQLKHVKLELKDEKIEGGIEKAMQSYQKFLEETPESAMTPEALRRLADLKIEKEYGVAEGAGSASKIDRPAGFDARRSQQPGKQGVAERAAAPAEIASANSESSKDFENRAVQADEIKSAAAT